MKKTVIISLFLIALLLFFTGSVYAASSGTYTSEPIGEANVVSFKTFEAIGQTIPDGSSIKYNFSGSKNNYSTWSEEISLTSTDGVSINSNYDLSDVAQLKGSDHMKVKITMTAKDENSSPTLQSFRITYEKLGGETGSQTGTISGSSALGSAGKLVATGGNLWFNILIALVLAGGIGYFVIWRKNKH